MIGRNVELGTLGRAYESEFVAVHNICEKKFSNRPFALTKKYAQELQTKIDVFREVENVRKSIFLTLVSASGVADNSYADALQSVAVLDDLFGEGRT